MTEGWRISQSAVKTKNRCVGRWSPDLGKASKPAIKSIGLRGGEGGKKEEKKEGK